MVIPSKHLELKQNKAFSPQIFPPIACSYPRWQDNRSRFARVEEILQDQVKKSKEENLEFLLVSLSLNFVQTMKKKKIFCGFKSQDKFKN